MRVHHYASRTYPLNADIPYHRFLPEEGILISSRKHFLPRTFWLSALCMVCLLERWLLDELQCVSVSLLERFRMHPSFRLAILPRADVPPSNWLLHVQLLHQFEGANGARVTYREERARATWPCQ